MSRPVPKSASIAPRVTSGRIRQDDDHSQPYRRQRRAPHRYLKGGQGNQLPENRGETPRQHDEVDLKHVAQGGAMR